MMNGLDDIFYFLLRLHSEVTQPLSVHSSSVLSPYSYTQQVSDYFVGQCQS